MHSRARCLEYFVEIGGLAVDPRLVVRFAAEPGDGDDVGLRAETGACGQQQNGDERELAQTITHVFLR